jgi:hypothetical protein
LTLDVDEQDEARIAERQKLVDEQVAAYEKEMNSYGLSFERSREIITRGLDLFPLPYDDPTTNETLLRIRADPELMRKELEGGLDPEGCKEWVEAVDWIEQVCVCVCACVCVRVVVCTRSNTCLIHTHTHTHTRTRTHTHISGWMSAWTRRARQR